MIEKKTKTRSKEFPKIIAEAEKAKNKLSPGQDNGESSSKCDDDNWQHKKLKLNIRYSR